MLREVNMDNNCVGWYQSMFLGTYNNTTVIETQLQYVYSHTHMRARTHPHPHTYGPACRYQENLSDNTVIILYDPIQTANGSLTIKAFRLSDAFVQM